MYSYKFNHSVNYVVKTHKNLKFLLVLEILPKPLKKMFWKMLD